ncbi:MAG: UDP-N-acetylmuramate:L-alanyl-gamma-D-glutamyl-meso-diaminopimelate ligase [Acidobacteria bacterium]|nr:UDP-N-acetylmuramate:L-alanyl-gamma-D-glutamyl-meso-diaminopimelate ligase [Acidobacteriota bacterium]MXZ71697.1 UDP-N-acetylmuramate:L-alanyl-gamma-D-glutamyl-meso-diaminopimelate ligase [Acidobacteriota bacterium]MYD71927.1 UDP-N-acetylmuramate:L-alanyl-gamma-D-glutamyl-meso-diaminopimelate ligase [Acidobacteriota bacterium]MYJ04923.1 UDP-N-acetylmuramate:L-alanyl-gamma-D-glutamyl-meso-diaminopimelate ligase [Acidobacteriota bacterium]
MSRVHLIGVCGTAMATLAAMLKQQGWIVTGSDVQAYPPMGQFLASQGIAPLIGYDAAHVPADVDLAVIGNAVSRGNPEVEAVLDRRIRYASLAETIREHFLWGRRTVVIAGTHGKTTTTSMTAWALVEAGADPGFLVGGVPRNFDAGYRLGAGDLFVIEGDEYDSAYFDKTAKFLKYLPFVAVVGSLEFDHADIYDDIDALTLAFRRFVGLVPHRGRLLLGADDPGARALADAAHCPVETFGFADDADWRAADVDYGPDRTAFDVRRAGATIARVDLPLLGAFNVRNALAAIAAGAAAGVAPDRLAAALRTFRGVRRRLELSGVGRGVSLYDDFAHHPTAVRETVAALRAASPTGRIWVLFEPRSATSCRRFFQSDYAAGLAGADEVVVAPVYRTAIPAEQRLDGARLAADLTASGTRARYVDSTDAIAAVVEAETRAGDVVVLMSNGDFGGLRGQLRERLGIVGSVAGETSA